LARAEDAENEAALFATLGVLVAEDDFEADLDAVSGPSSPVAGRAPAPAGVPQQPQQPHQPQQPQQPQQQQQPQQPQQPQQLLFPGAVAQVDQQAGGGSGSPELTELSEILGLSGLSCPDSSGWEEYFETGALGSQ
jgi:hypothetical protein